MVVNARLGAALELIDTLKGEREHLLASLDDAGAQLLVARAESETLRAEHEDTARHWREQLELKAREMEAAMAEIPSQRDMELLRLKVVEEMELIKKKKWEAVQAECEKYRRLFFQARTEHEKLKTDSDRMFHNYERQVSDQAAQFTDHIKTLQTELSKARLANNSQHHLEKHRAAQRENLDLTVKVQQLMQENEELRAGRTALVSAHDSATRNLQRLLSDANMATSGLKVEKVSLTERVNKLEMDNNQLTQRYHDITEEASRLDKELRLAERRVEEELHRFNIECSDMKTAAVKARIDQNKEKTALIRDLDIAKNEVSHANATINELTLKIKEREAQTYEKIKITQEEEWSKQRVLEMTRDTLAAELQEAKQSAMETISTLSRDNDRLQQEIAMLSGKLSRLNSSSHDLALERNTLQTETQLTTNEQSKLRHQLSELQDKYLRLHQKHEALKASEATLQETVVTLENKIITINGELKKRSENTRSYRSHYEENLKSCRAAWSKERKGMQEMSMALEAECNESKDLLQQLTQKYEKVKALSLHKISEYRLQLKLAHDSAQSMRQQYERIESELFTLRSRDEDRRQSDRKAKQELLKLVSSEVSSSIVAKA